MLNYIIRRLLLLPLTLLCIILVNFVIINLAPGDPVTVTEISADGASRQEKRSVAFGSDERYLQFREHYGLTLPILFNTWAWTSQSTVDNLLKILISKKKSSQATEEMPVKEYDALRVSFGDRSRYIMDKLLFVLTAQDESIPMRAMASRFFARGGTRQAYLGSNLKTDQKLYNRKIAIDNNFLRKATFSPSDPKEDIQKKSQELSEWYIKNREFYGFEPTSLEKFKIFFFDSRFFRYMSRVLTLDFGTMRNDSNKSVVSEVTKRFKYSLTLAILPMLIAFALCQIFGFTMAYKQHRWQDYSLSIFFLTLYALPIFVVAPFLIEKVALNGHFPLTQIPIPVSGFTSSESVYSGLNSYQRLFNVFQHICLPIIAILYGTLASESRLSRTAVLEVLRQDFVRTARAKGVPPLTILYKHVGRNAAITIVTSLAGSLGIILGGSLIVETLFEIDGFGKFFYDAIVNRDYNVIMFSSLAGSLLALIGYLTADIAYTVLDPRLSLE
ncbi:MAG: ABC transporter permease [Parachlamydiaceae bacterium]|nr:ABC transporter permease [Parachlamydiaceae bacterium]